MSAAARERSEALARAGRRVIAVATRRLPHAPNTVAAAERALSFTGLVAFLDPLRAGVPDAVVTLAGAGVRTIVVTGDHPSTAAAVAREAGLDGGGDVLLGGAALESLDDDVLAARLVGMSVIARATPADKLRVVRILQASGEAVAVTGDGVNDAPALAAANVGIAMGRRGTDLAREAADLVLTDDAYPAISTAVAAGRSLSAQLRRAVAFYLGAKIALVATVAVPLLLGLPSPFDPVQIVLLELFMDLGASVAFVSEPAAPQAMRRGPRDPSARFLDRPEVLAIATTAVALTAAALPAYLVTRPIAGDAVASAAAFAAWLLAHVAIAWSLRAQPGLRWSRNVAFPAWGAAAAVTAALVTLTPAGDAISTEQLTAAALAVTCAAAALGAALAAAARWGFSQPLQL